MVFSTNHEPLCGGGRCSSVVASCHYGDGRSQRCPLVLFLGWHASRALQKGWGCIRGNYKNGFKVLPTKQVYYIYLRQPLCTNKAMGAHRHLPANMADAGPAGDTNDAACQWSLSLSLGGDAVYISPVAVSLPGVENYLTPCSCPIYKAALPAHPPSCLTWFINMAVWLAGGNPNDLGWGERFVTSGGCWVSGLCFLEMSI